MPVIFTTGSRSLALFRLVIIEVKASEIVCSEFYMNSNMSQHIKYFLLKKSCLVVLLITACGLLLLITSSGVRPFGYNSHRGYLGKSILLAGKWIIQETRLKQIVNLLVKPFPFIIQILSYSYIIIWKSLVTAWSKVLRYYTEYMLPYLTLKLKRTVKLQRLANCDQNKRTNKILSQL